MSLSNEPITFTISVDGEITGEKYRGEFKAKPRLTHREQLQRDRIRRELIGPDPSNAEVRALKQAEILSELAVRIVKAPSWWTESSGGLDLEDDAVLAEVYKQAMKAEEELLKALKEKADAAKADLAEQK
jgi:hypothetical protein